MIELEGDIWKEVFRYHLGVSGKQLELKAGTETPACFFMERSKGVQP